MARPTHVGKRRRRRGRRRRRARPDEHPYDVRGFFEAILGPVWTRRLSIAFRITGVLSFVLGCAVFLAWSQVIGQLLLAPALATLMTLLFVRWRENPWAAVRKRRAAFAAIGLALVAAGWSTFFALHQEAGLLLTVLGGAALSVLLLGVRHDPAGGPIDGPLFGETRESGGG